MQKGRDILRGFGPDSQSHQKPSATCGGVEKAKPMPYDPPKGPKGISSPTHGSLGGTNHGKAGTQGRH